VSRGDAKPFTYSSAATIGAPPPDMTAAMALDVKDKKVEVVAASGRFTGKGLGLYRGRSGEALSNGHLVAGATTPKPRVGAGQGAADRVQLTARPCC
jgi:hypothetical protein